jgi:hypothetical protein
VLQSGDGRAHNFGDDHISSLTLGQTCAPGLSVFVTELPDQVHKLVHNST